MTDIKTILDNATQWATEGVTKPQILDGILYNIDMATRGIVIKKLNSEDELIGVIDRNRYSPASYDIWSCYMVTMTSYADLEAIIGCVKRICAEYTFTDSENHLEWQGGDYVPFNNVRFAFYFSIVRKKSAIAEF